jgi:plasmid replication initiation protein
MTIMDDHRSMNNKQNMSALLPDRHPQIDFFVCDIFDATPKSDTASMQFPLFSLSTKPDLTPREYKKGDKWLKLTPSLHGLATVHDRDVLIYCISQCMAAINEGRAVEKKMRFQAMDLLTVTNRKTSGEGYKLLQAAMRRLQGTQIETNITTGGKEVWDVFSFIDNAQTVRKTRDGRMLEIEITLSDWIFNAIREQHGDILTISRDYFRLRKPLERRLYELARKHCGTKNKEWKFTLDELHDRTGSTSSPREFKRMLTNILENQDHIPDYHYELKQSTVYIYPKSAFTEKFQPKLSSSAIDKIRLKADTYLTAKRLAPKHDIYGIEDDWRRMLLQKGEGVPDKPDGSFIAYTKWFVKTNETATARDY